MLASLSLMLFVILIAGLKIYDVSAIGPENTSVGFSGINGACHELFGVSMFWYDVTEVLGYLAIAIAVIMAGAGFWQLLKRKSFAKVDREIYALAGLYVALGALYVIFEKIVINYRPVILPDDEGVEASFPSSHTMLSFVIFGSTVMLLSVYMEKSTKRLVMQIVLEILIFLTVFGRLICGVHWFTDILGGVLISVCLLSVFGTFLYGDEE